MHSWFVTGTDTEIGKTRASCDLVRYLAGRGQRVAVAKPIASGCEQTAAGLRNEDALALQAASNLELPYELVNPYRFEPPIAPHLAAAAAQTRIDLDKAAAIRGALHGAHAADWLIAEGAGGWNVPLDGERLLRELAGAFTQQVLLVVGMRLGCINHALLSARQILADGFELVGWVANHVDPNMLEQEGNLATLDHFMPAPRLGTIPYNPVPPGVSEGAWELPSRWLG
jgi:dethiobiotin synthetase